ncbi:hypothetical protein [Sphingobacterium faecale]|uniref:DUF4251 domain-containing protein n=1 Tax=Sphingobacterium faecale TaxID=2803775 RepID=A0ABS1R5R1_9SPHI|nr:hypothetical protein [Sphingobacterium faecale]MBL1409569.1 hypothetical protein [Sphingobacterium faecale]
MRKILLFFTILLIQVNITKGQQYASYQVTKIDTYNVSHEFDAATLKQFSGKKIYVTQYSDHIKVSIPEKIFYARKSSTEKDTYTYFEADEKRKDEGILFGIRGLRDGKGTIQFHFKEINIMSKITDYKAFHIIITAKKTQ